MNTSECQLVRGGRLGPRPRVNRSAPLAAVAAERAKRGCPVSVAFSGLHRDSGLEEIGIRRWTHALLAELSILGPDQMPWHPGAQIVRVREPARPVQLDDLNARLRRLGISKHLEPLTRTPACPSSPTTVATSDRRVVGESYRPRRASVSDARALYEQALLAASNGPEIEAYLQSREATLKHDF